ncbi:hypothetical protein GOP47_0006025 [Adiantum capillus-veneris]|uniref:Uncharacterized protein n=1 Tax=Adiantum capillus-veneris TaxID=13818 RepID=A0A9D4ZK05_ADICA|nr:hypothetical protein GOP47_0006025 [Adiantum capillus-veneris]
MAAQLSAAHHLSTALPFLRSYPSPASSTPSTRIAVYAVRAASSSSSSSSTSPSRSVHDGASGVSLAVSSSPLSLSSLLSIAAALSPTLLDNQDALAVEGQFGILEGRSFALVHPIVMGGLLVYTLWAGYLGWQWRRVRTVQDEINVLKKDVKPAEEGAPPSSAESKIKELTEVRKALVKGGYRDRHYNAGSILLAFGVFESVGGCVNTWFRTGKLFPGPHLFAGAGITVLWALAAALVPAMQKGDETARSLHIALNTVNVLLFLWQVPTGLEIVLKVFEFTSWP